MINLGFMFGLVIIMQFGLLSATIMSPLKVDPSSLHLYKTGLRNELDYILKRSGSQNTNESPDSKERRSQMGSSFIRFGRSRIENGIENPEFSTGFSNDADTNSRIPRGRSDFIIRLARAGLEGKLDFGPGRNFRLLPLDLQQLIFLCSDVSNNDSNGNELARLCNSVPSGFNDDNKN